MKKNMKRLLSMLAVVAVFCTAIPLSALAFSIVSDNLLQNGNFEQGADGWSMGGGTALSTDARDGKQAVLMTHTSAWGEALTQTVSVAANTDYTLSFWTKRVAGGAAWDMFVYNKDTMTVVPLTAGTNWFAPGSDWTQVTVEFNSTTATTLFIKFCPESSPAGQVLLDDAVLSKTDGDTPDTPTVSVALQNGGFEQGAEGWSLGGLTAVSTDAHGGKQAMLLSHPYAWGEALTQTLTAAADTDYVLSFWAKRVSGSGAWDLFVYNADAMSVLSLTAGTNWFGPGADWTRFTVEFNSAAAASLFIKFCPESANGGEILLDDVTLSVKGAEPDQPDTPDQPDLPVGLQNGDFEQGTAGWVIGGKTAVSTDAHGGKQAMLLSHPHAWGEALTQTLAVAADTDYVLSFWAKRVSGDAAWDLFVYNADAMSVLSLTAGTNWFGPAAEWTQFTVEFNSAAAASLFIKFCPESDTSGQVLVDDVLLYKKGEEPVEPDQPDEAAGLLNGDFELGDQYWSMGGGTAISTADMHSGVNAVLLTHTSAWGEALTQTVTVKANTVYTLTFWVKRVSGGGVWDAYVLDPNANYSPLELISGEVWFGETDKQWVQKTVTFNSGDRTTLFVKFCPESEAAGTFMLDDVFLTAEGDTPPTPPDPVDPPAAPLGLSSFGVDNNRPMDPSLNLIQNAGFESTEGAQWNTDTFLDDTVTVVEDTTSPDGGNKVLYVNTAGTTEEQAAWHIFWVDIAPDTEYVFSVWMKGAFMSKDNVARTTVGVIDPDTKLFLKAHNVHPSTDMRQLVPPAWDNQWHLRSVSFNSGAKTRIGIAVYGYGSQLWLDAPALYEMDNGVKYQGANTLASVSINFNIDQTSCDPQDSLTDNLQMEQGTAFWSEGNGWRNGFLSLLDSEYDYGTSLKYTGDQDSVGIHYIKWIDVQPQTDYIFSVDMKVLANGDGRLVLLDGKRRHVTTILQVDFDKDYYGEEWFHSAIGFNTGVFDTIGIAVVDAGGEALIDNVRLFEAADASDYEDPYVAPPTPPQADTPDEPTTDEPLVDDPAADDPVDTPDESEPGKQPSKKPVKKPVSPAPAGSAMWLWIGIGSGVVLLAAAVVLLIVIKKRKKKPADNA